MPKFGCTYFFSGLESNVVGCLMISPYTTALNIFGQRTKKTKLHLTVYIFMSSCWSFDSISNFSKQNERKKKRQLFSL